MNPFVKQMVNHKINSITPKQLYQLGTQYNTPISMKQAEQITSILHEQPIDVMDGAQRSRVLGRIAREVNPDVAKKIKSLLEVFL
ncbi:MAG TPA: DUF2624 family protein [Bacillales bacterium]|nr:DUF2624 family protein [Bacillales bacterium]